MERVGIHGLLVLSWLLFAWYAGEDNVLRNLSLVLVASVVVLPGQAGRPSSGHGAHCRHRRGLRWRHPRRKPATETGQLPGILGLALDRGDRELCARQPSLLRDEVQEIPGRCSSRDSSVVRSLFIGHDAFTFFVDHPAMTRDGSSPAHLQRLLAAPSLPMLAGERHAAVKRQILDAFNDEAMARYIPVIENAIRRSLDRWETWDEEFSWIPEFQDTAYLISDALFTGSDPAKRGLLQYRKTLDEFRPGFTPRSR